MLKRDIQFNNKIHFTSLGCARNLVDSEVMIGILLKSGYELTPDLKEADFLVINTCGFLEASRQEALTILDELFKEKKPSGKIVVTGCMVQKNESLLRERFPDIHYMLGSGDVEKILNAVTSDLPGSAVTNAKSYLEWGEVPRMLSTPKHYAYLKIAEGCMKRCSFCIIPSIKGPLKSKTIEQVMKEFNILLSQGVFEIILIAQDLGDFGKDRKEKNALHELIREMLKVKKDFWIRFLYLYPDEIDDELIALMKSDSRICPYLDMPLQHINDEMLKKMRRKTNRAQILSIIEKLRAEVPNVVIRTSLMVGFPTETEEQFQELVEFVKEAKLNHIGVFKYSKEKESHSATLEGHLPDDVKEKRYEILMKEQMKAVKKNLRKLEGRIFSVMVEGYHPDSPLLMRGRYYGQCPDIDGQIIINEHDKVKAFSKLYDVEITGSTDYDLIGRVLGPTKNKKDASCKLAFA
jgi:ribosomal protein S12 methylthiotransferase